MPSNGGEETPFRLPDKAWQRKIRDDLTASEPKPTARSLHGYSIGTISRAEAKPVIIKYEWLGTMGQATEFIGLISPDGEIQGVACFGEGPGGPIRQMIGTPAYCLERGACVHYAPRNAASFLINGACKLVYRMMGVSRFFAYGDPRAGEYGAVYQAAGWVYLGRGLNGKTGRPMRDFILRPGRNPDDPKAWQTTRGLRRGSLKTEIDAIIRAAALEGEELTAYEAARELGYRIERKPSKHVYAINVGRDRRSWRKNISALPYPKRDFDPDGNETVAMRATVMEPCRRIVPIDPQISLEL